MFLTRNPQICQNPPTWDQDDLALLIHLSWKLKISLNHTVICKGFFSKTNSTFSRLSKILSNHRVVMEKRIFSMTTLWFDKFFWFAKLFNDGGVTTIAIWEWGFHQCLPFSWTTLRGIHCRHPIAVMGVVDTFGPGLFWIYSYQIWYQILTTMAKNQIR